MKITTKDKIVRWSENEDAMTTIIIVYSVYFLIMSVNVISVTLFVIKKIVDAMSIIASVPIATFCVGLAILLIMLLAKLPNQIFAKWAKEIKAYNQSRQIELEAIKKETGCYEVCEAKSSSLYDGIIGRRETNDRKNI